MSINPAAIGRISAHVDRLSQGGADSVFGGGTTGLGAGRIPGIGGPGGNPGGGLGGVLSGKFAQLMSDPMAQMTNPAVLQGVLGLDGGEGVKNLTPEDSAISGGLNLTNVKALATLTKVMGNEESPMANMFRSIPTPEGNAIRMPVNKSTASFSAHDPVSALQASSRAAARGDMRAALSELVNAANAMKAQRTPEPAAPEAPEQPDSLEETDEYGLYAKAEEEARREFAEATRLARNGDAGFRPGALSALFESGGDGGIAAIGYDRRGGTSYGKFQMSSRAGTMDAFIRYLDTHAPDMASRLRQSGSANTGSRSGAMPAAWKEIASSQPARFEELQDNFIHRNHFSPAYRAISKAMNVDSMSPAMQEVLFSTAVHHGPTGAVRIFAKAYGRTGGFSPASEAEFIRNIYSIRQRQFTTSTEGVRTAVQGRLGDELRMALSMLERGDMA